MSEKNKIEEFKEVNDLDIESVKNEINKLKITSYDIRAEIQRLNQILQAVESKIQENTQILNEQL